MKFVLALCVILFVSVAFAQCPCQQSYPSYQPYYSGGYYQPSRTYYDYTPRTYYSTPRYYDYGTGRYVSSSERAWLDNRAESVLTGGYAAPPLMKILRIWVNTH